MNFRRSIFILLAPLLWLSGLAVRPLPAAPPSEMVARVHWLGLQQISADTNSARLMGVWQLPQTTALVAQTLDKFSRWPGGGATNAASALLRPLLDDLVSSEFYLEVYSRTNSSPVTRPPSLFLALRLPTGRARLWQTNLPAALNRVEISQAGEWTVVGLGDGAAGLLPGFAARLTRLHLPFATNFWLEADLDPAFLPRATRHASLSRLAFTVTGEAGDILTRGTFDFSQPMDLRLSPWEIPTNFIHQPLSSFAAVRGLAGSPVWSPLQLAPPPDQMFVWTQPDVPMQAYFAAPLPGASNQLSRLAARLVQNANPWLATNGQGSFQWQTRPPGLVWNGVFLLSPFLQPVRVNQHDFVLGGLTRFDAGNPNPMPAEFLHAVLGTPNLVFFQAEQTSVRIEADLFLTQLLRVNFHKAQLPPDAAAIVWLKKTGPLLGDTTTVVTRTGPNQLAFKRKSTLGFAGLELHLLADWLESPQFPCGLHTFLAPPDK